MSPRRFAALVVVGSLVWSTSPLESQDTSGALSGVILDDYTGAFVARATVALPALGRAIVTDSMGRFDVVGLPVGSHEIRFEADGYVSVVEELEIAESDFLQVRLTPLTAVLDEIMVVTGRPRRARDPVGMPVKIDGAPWRSVLDLLEDQVPGVVVRRRGALGAGAAIWMRGMGTFTASSAPDVYLDGVRIDSSSNPDALHALDQIHADQVARISVFRGAASGGARSNANGAIVIETHRGSRAASGNR